MLFLPGSGYPDPPRAREGDRLEEPPSIPRRSRSKPRTARYLLMFVACVLIANALVGEKGLAAILRANRQQRELASSIAELKRENAGLRQYARQLREGPQMIEHLARRELGLIEPGEKLFIIAPTPSSFLSTLQDTVPELGTLEEREAR